MNRVIQAIVATVPLLLTPVLFFGLAEGVINLGGGEKDIIWVFPWLLWSIIFAICSYVFILKNHTVLNWVRYSFAISMSVMLALFMLAYVVSFLGIAWTMTETEQKFVSEPIRPVVATADTNAMAAGGPGLPQEFIWRGKVLGIATVLRNWHDSGPCKHGSPESYVRKHWFEVETTGNQRAKIYFDRQPRGRKLTERWWLYSIEENQSGR